MAPQQALAVTDHADDIENQLRCNNVRIVGLSEKVEGRDPTAFVEQWLLDIFGREVFTPFLL